MDNVPGNGRDMMSAASLYAFAGATILGLCFWAVATLMLT